MDNFTNHEKHYGVGMERSTTNSWNLKQQDTERPVPPPYKERPGRLVCIRFGETGLPEAHFYDDTRSLREELVTSSPGGDRLRRLFILEGLSQRWTIPLGARLGIPYTFWEQHEDTEPCELTSSVDGRALPLATSAATATSLMLGYSQMWSLSGQAAGPGIRLWCEENRRRIQLYRIGTKSAKPVVGAVRQRVSFWSNSSDNGGWNGLIVTDAPFKTVVTDHDGDFKAVLQINQSNDKIFRGGYVDFTPVSSASIALENSGPPKTSLLDDLVYYHIQHWSLLKLTSDPRSVLTFVQKIVASESALLLRYNYNIIHDLHLRIMGGKGSDNFDPEWVRSNWRQLKHFQHRLVDYRLLNQRAIDQLRWGPDPKGFKATHVSRSADVLEWTDPVADFELVDKQINTLLERLDYITPAFSMMSTEHSLSEAHNVRFLTILGIIFIPLSFVATFFSMSDTYRPGGQDHWVYWVVSFLLSMLVVGSMLLKSKLHLLPRIRQKFVSKSMRPAITWKSYDSDTENRCMSKV